MIRRLLHVSGRRVRFAAFPRPRLYSTPGKVKIFVKDPTGGRSDFEAPVGISLMEAVRDVAGMALEGTCDGCMQCSTCHVYIAEGWFKKLPPPSEQEMDVLDMALEPRDESRLACQITLREAHDGLEIEIPSAMKDLTLS
ncbi:unnamed protein product [Phytomonas sp. EM1]|nr:unnamed protein product [Phytomonas sp. EM1]|eukprot:CCW65523.1 unnamed protein product [Phytomonas sp. isolate EM1]